jgi:hypothetical protein
MFKVHEVSDEFGVKWAVFRHEGSCSAFRVATFDAYEYADHYARLMSAARRRAGVMAELAGLDAEIRQILES